MAINIHTDRKLEEYLEWLSRQSEKTKTDVIKDLVYERYRLKQVGFRFGAFKTEEKISSKKLQRELKELDSDHDLD